MVDEGQMVEVGTPIISVGDPESAVVDPSGAAPASTTDGSTMEIDLSNPAASGGGEGESLVGRMKAERGPVRRPRRGSASPASESAAATQMQVQGAFAPGGAQSEPVIEADEPAVPAVPASEPHREAMVPPAATGSVRALAKPPVRKLAKDLGVDLGSVRATGPDGTVTRDDVQAAAGGASGVTESAGGAPSGRTADRDQSQREHREPIKGVRKMMGQAMVDSAFTIPHVTEWITIDVTATMAFVERLKKRREFKDVKVSPLLVLSRAVMLAMRRTPEINSFWDGAAGEVVFKNYVNLGIAAATPRGLVVPNVKDADQLSLLELAEALSALARTARDGKTQPAEMSGGTFTITNVGVFGVDAGTPIINPGESAILCFGSIKKKPWVDEDGELCVRDVTTLALSFDHRHVDGEKGSRFLADVASILEDPASALLF